VHQRRSRLTVALAAALALCAGVPAGALAHAIVQPAASRPADQQVYTLIVPNERDVDTTSIRMAVPAGVDSVSVERVAGYKTTLERSGGRVTEVRWDGVVPAGFHATLRFIARNPVEQGTIAWKVLQTYAGGETVRWIGAPDSDQPAPRVRIAEDAAPQEVVSTHGAAEASAPAATAGKGGTTGRPAPAAAATSGGDDATLATVLAGVAVALAAAALAVALLGRRTARPRRTR
jgi:uncharacterized protein YcnI